MNISAINKEGKNLVYGMNCLESDGSNSNCARTVLTTEWKNLQKNYSHQCARLLPTLKKNQAYKFIQCRLKMLLKILHKVKALHPNFKA